MDLESEIDIYYDCDECGKSFQSDSQMRLHKQEAHVAKYESSFCDNTFCHPSDLRAHIGSNHSDLSQLTKSDDVTSERVGQMTAGEIQPKKRSCKCKECNKMFTTKAGLRYHNKFIHERTQSFQCPDCVKSFRHEKSLDKHIEREHLKLERPAHFYKCEDCGKTLQTGCLFHVCKNEVPMTCEECGEVLSNGVEFKLHKKTEHASNTRYYCTVCEKTFSTMDYLESHFVKKHPENDTSFLTDEHQGQKNIKAQSDRGCDSAKKHKCDYCDTAFSIPQNLRRHIQRMHKAKE